MAHIQTINLKENERVQVSVMLTHGRWSQNEIKRAQILDLANREKEISNGTIAERLHCDRDTVREIRKRYINEGLQSALTDRPRSGQPKKLTSREEALIVATACSKVPAGYDHWTIKMLTEAINVKRKDNPIGKNPVVKVLMQNELKPWRKKNVGYSGCNS